MNPEEEKEKKYIPVYKKGYRSKTYHPPPQSNVSFFSTTGGIKQKRKAHSKTQQNKKIIKHYDKVLVFDLDETLGSFSELQWIWNAIIKRHEYSKPFLQNIVKTLIDIYPEFLRPGILHILEYIAQKKKKGECIAIFIYTNNQNPPPWTEFIIGFFNQYIKEKTNIRSFFDQIIQAFKIGQEKIEWMRTSHDKSYDDFIKCSILPKHTEICFIDNTYFHSMIHPKVYYIQPKSYQHSLSTQDIIQRFILAETSGILDDFFPVIPSFPSASSFLFFSTTQSQNHSRKIIVKNFIEHTMEEYTNHKQLRLHYFLPPPADLPLQITPQQCFENIQIDLFVSQKLLDFIREFFVLTTFSNLLTRKYTQTPSFLHSPSKSVLPPSSEITVWKITT